MLAIFLPLCILFNKLKNAQCLSVLPVPSTLAVSRLLQQNQEVTLLCELPGPERGY